jgi:hypothetical protein
VCFFNDREIRRGAVLRIYGVIFNGSSFERKVTLEIILENTQRYEQLNLLFVTNDPVLMTGLRTSLKERTK